MAIDTIFLCFCEDCEQNDGLNRPYFMSRGLMVSHHMYLNSLMFIIFCVDKTVCPRFTSTYFTNK